VLEYSVTQDPIQYLSAVEEGLDTVAAVVVISIQTLQRRASQRKNICQRIAKENNFPKDCRGNFFPKGFDQ
jgi:hypothetical protein